MTGTEINQMNCNFKNLPTIIFLNDYSVQERFSMLMCAMIYSGLASNTDWSHDLFGNVNFSVNTYQQQLEDFILENHDWDSESSNFKNEAINVFGSNWKIEVSKAVSWIGLENTSEYSNYANYINQLSNPAQQLYLLDIQNKILNAEDDCQ